MEKAGFGEGGFSLTYISASQSQHSCQGMWGYAARTSSWNSGSVNAATTSFALRIRVFTVGTVAENRLCGEARARVRDKVQIES